MKILGLFLLTVRYAFCLSLNIIFLYVCLLRVTYLWICYNHLFLGLFACDTLFSKLFSELLPLLGSTLQMFFFNFFISIGLTFVFDLIILDLFFFHSIYHLLSLSFHHLQALFLVNLLSFFIEYLVNLFVNFFAFFLLFNKLFELNSLKNFRKNLKERIPLLISCDIRVLGTFDFVQPMSQSFVLRQADIPQLELDFTDNI